MPTATADPPAPSTATSEVLAGFAAILAAHTRGPAHLTKNGLTLVQRVLFTPSFVLPDPPRPAADQPAWDRMRRRLCLGGRLIRTFSRLAPRQMAILDALQSAGWLPSGVPSPFGLSAVGRKRLRNSVNNLNRRLATRRFRLREDGAQVWWEAGGRVRATTRKYAEERGS